MMSITSDWNDYLADEFKKDYMQSLQQFLQAEKQQKALYPEELEYFTALNYTPFSQVKVVILGQDPITEKGKRMACPFQWNLT